MTDQMKVAEQRAAEKKNKQGKQNNTNAENVLDDQREAGDESAD